MDLSVLLNETLPNLISNTISGVAASYVSYRLGIKQAIEDGNAAVLRQMINTNDPRFSPLELAKCKNIIDIAKLAETYRKIEKNKLFLFIFLYVKNFYELK